MNSFEKFHPVLTAHYTLDWLTQTPVKQVDDLFNSPYFTTVSAERLPNEIFDTIKGVNRIMRKVMNGSQLTWGITNSNTMVFKGIITVSGFNANQQTGVLDFTFVKQEDQGLSEVIQRVVEFVKDHFSFTHLAVNIDTPVKAIEDILSENHFKTTDQRHFKLTLPPAD